MNWNAGPSKASSLRPSMARGTAMAASNQARSLEAIEGPNSQSACRISNVEACRPPGSRGRFTGGRLLPHLPSMRRLAGSRGSNPSSKDDTCERRLDLAVDRCRIRDRCRCRFNSDSHNPGGDEYLSMVVRRQTRDRVTGLTFPDYHRVSAAGRPRRGRKCACFRRTWLVLPSACASAGPRP